jgi:hypothetical protein
MGGVMGRPPRNRLMIWRTRVFDPSWSSWYNLS